MFDNRITQHYASDDYGDLPRLLHRVTVAGDVPVGVDGRESYRVEGDDPSHYTRPRPEPAMSPGPGPAAVTASAACTWCRGRGRG